MKKVFNFSLRYIFYASLLITFISGCKIQFSDAMQMGQVMPGAIDQTIEFIPVRGLIIIPVNIKGTEYRFLYDTGAPSAISEAIQNKYGFKVVSTSDLTDAQGNKQKTKYVEIDTLRIQGIPFINTAAFVGNFENNPVLKCLKLDGIIGANLMRYYTWQIDLKNNKLRFTNQSINDICDSNHIFSSFNTDDQYSVLLDFKADEIVVKNIKVDYGFNSWLSLPGNIFDEMENKEVFKDVVVKVGTTTSGLFGKAQKHNTNIGVFATCSLNSLQIDNLEVQTGKSRLLGTRLLEKYLVTIDWNSKSICFGDPEKISIDELSTYGFSIGLSESNRIFFQSIIIDGPAQLAGIEPDMIIDKLNDFSFEGESDFCNYVNDYKAVGDSVKLGYYDFGGVYQDTILVKKILFSN